MVWRTVIFIKRCIKMSCRVFNYELNDITPYRSYLILIGVGLKHIGAQGIRSIMEDIMTDIMFTAPGKEAGKCIITKNTVHTKKPIYKVA